MGSGSNDTTPYNPYQFYGSNGPGGTSPQNPDWLNQTLSQGQQQLGQEAQNFLPQIGQYLSQGQTQVNDATQSGSAQLGSLYGGAQNQITNMENQNLGQVNGLLNNYDQSFISQLAPTGQLGQQLAGEYNNVGAGPSSGAFQAGLGNAIGTQGAQNALTLGQQALQPGINAQYSTLGQGLGAQTGVLQAGTELNQQLGSQEGTAPLSLLGNTLSQQQSLTNEGTQLPIQNYLNSLGFQGASGLGSQNVAAQNSASNNQLLGQLGSSGLGALAK